MSWSNWSFRFHNHILKHSNDGLFRLQEWNGTPGNIPHIEHCEKIGIFRTEKQWEKIFNDMFHGGKRSKSFRRMWWNIHRKEIYWHG